MSSEKIVTTVVLTKENHNYLKEKAKRDGRSLSNFLNTLIANMKEQ